MQKTPLENRKYPDGRSEATAEVFTNFFVWGLDLSGSLQGAGGVGGLLAEIKPNAGTVRYPFYDGNGNITDWMDADATLVAHHEYDPYGNETTGNPPSSFGFSTKPFDATLGLYYYGYRFYRPDWGRWVNRDMLNEADGHNIYAMLKNDSLGKIDLLGLASCSPTGPYLADTFSQKLGRVEHFVSRMKYYADKTDGRGGIPFKGGGITISVVWCECTCETRLDYYDLSIQCDRYEMLTHCELKGLCGTVYWSYTTDLGWSGGVVRAPAGKKVLNEYTIRASPMRGHPRGDYGCVQMCNNACTKRNRAPSFPTFNCKQLGNR